MTNERIDVLLNRYWNAETTIEEEKELKAYFSGSNVDSEYKEVALLFRTFQHEKLIQIPTPYQAPVVSSGPMHITKGGQWANRGRWLAAASIAGLVSVSIWWLGNNSTAQLATTNPVKINVEPFVLNTTENNVKTAVTNQMQVSSSNQKVQRKGRVAKKRDASAEAAALAAERKEAELAIEEIKAALALVSRKLNRSKKEAGKQLNQIEQISIFTKDKKEG